MGTIYRELKQTRPFPRPEEEAFVALLRTTDLLRTLAGNILAPWGISAEQYNVLRILRGAHPDGHPTLEVAARMVSRAPNITRLVDKLIRKGLVRRDRGRGDRRIVTLRITDEGLKVTTDAAAAMGRMILEIMSGLTRAQLHALIDAVDNLRGRARLDKPT